VGTGAALYSPAKYGILPELAEHHLLVKANSWIEGSTILAILLGMIVGAQLADYSIDMALSAIITRAEPIIMPIARNRVNSAISLAVLLNKISGAQAIKMTRKVAAANQNMEAPKIAKRARGVIRNFFKWLTNNTIFQPGSAVFLA
jgi:hypothetical protein